MEEKKDFYQAAEEICARDPRYKADAYEFLMQALHFTQTKLKRTGHISGVELLEGIREFAVEQYGAMARTVLAHWGIAKTQDFGNIVFNMVESKLLSKTDQDSVNDFKDIYDFDTVFSKVLNDSVIKEMK
ncbi:MAG: hypothetical protein PHG40_04015 [Candidatus Omnitrophica bacterium]|nr:hypothetical protein [Candidatus Omnitrophota bacterium]